MSGDVICLSTADWDAEVWTNKQHLMLRLARAGTRVLYVDSLGLRAPSANARDGRRIVKRLRDWRSVARAVEPGLWRDIPLVVPLPWARDLNARLLKARLARNTRRFGLRRPLIWTYTPAAVDVYDRAIHRGLIYHCVDDLAAYPGVDAARFRAQERELVAAANVCIASSRPLVAHLKSLGAERVLYWPNPADVGQFDPALMAARRRGARVQVGFLGAVQEHKVDVQLLVDMARSRPDWDIVLVGPVGLGLQHSQLSNLRWPDNVRLAGRVEHGAIPGVLAGFDVALIPYRINDYTRSVFPMKVFEYLAAGLGVVSTPLPSIMGEVEHVRFASTPAGLVAGVEAVLDEDARRPHARDERVAHAQGHSWDGRCAEALSLIAALVREQQT